MQSAHGLVDVIQSLPPARQAEVEQFVAAREREATLTRDAAHASAPPFEAVWDNDEDAVYDAV